MRTLWLIGLQDIRGDMECGRKDAQQLPQPRRFFAGGGLSRHICLRV